MRFLGSFQLMVEVPAGKVQGLREQWAWAQG